MPGLGTLLISAVLFGTLSMTFQPPQNFDFSLVNITLPPGSTIKQTEEIADRVAKIVQRDPDVDRTFERVRVGTARVNVVLKKDRVKTSTEYERSMAPALAAIPDARVSFQSQNGGGPDGASRDIMLYLGGDDPEKLNDVAVKISEEMATSPACERRASAATCAPEIAITPRFDVAADLGVTTAALSQTIRIATMGDIEQNSAKFSLADRQVPITCRFPKCPPRHRDAREPACADIERGLGTVEIRGEDRLRVGPTTIQRTNQIRRIAVGADLAPGLVERRRVAQDQ